MRMAVCCGCAALAIAAGCRSASTPAPDLSLTPHADSLLNCAERELFSHGYRVRRVMENRLRLRAEPQLTANAFRPRVIMVEYDPETHGLAVWAQVARSAPGELDASPEVAQLAWAVEDACTPKDGKGDKPK